MDTSVKKTPAYLPGIDQARRLPQWVRVAGEGVYTFCHFIRLPALSLTLMLPLLGAATVARHLEPLQILGILTVAFAAHCFTYVLNDLVDLPVDRTQPLKAHTPLVRGRIRPGAAWAFVSCQLPLAFGLTALLGGPPGAHAALAGTFGLVTFYNFHGKRSTFPPFTDAAQGLACAGFALYGALLVGGQATILTGEVGAFIIVFCLLANGVHGSLRDVSNDLRCGLRTTAIMLGARPDGGTGVVIPRMLKGYTLALQAVLIGLSFLPLLRNDLGYGPATWTATLVVLSGSHLLALILLAGAVRVQHDLTALLRLGVPHMFVALASLPILFLPLLDPLLQWGLLLAVGLPALTHEYLNEILRRTWRTGSRIVRSRILRLR